MLNKVTKFDRDNQLLARNLASKNLWILWESFGLLGYLWEYLEKFKNSRRSYQYRLQNWGQEYKENRNEALCSRLPVS